MSAVGLFEPHPARIEVGFAGGTLGRNLPHQQQVRRHPNILVGPGITVIDAKGEPNQRHVKTEESLRLGVVSGWYSTIVSGTFVSGPHDSEADCLRRILEINPPPAPKKKMVAS